MPGTFYQYVPTGVGDAGAGVRDWSFVYPWSRPAMDVFGPGNQCGDAPSPVFKPLYFNHSQVISAAQGSGVIQGNLSYTTLLPNFYRDTNPAL